ncbi:MAG: acetate--CoA ligase family protein [Candidatus Aenigmatarchaeota archaeon]
MMRPKELLQLAVKDGRKALREEEIKIFLSHYGVKIAEGKVATNLNEALKIAGSIGYPVVLKLVSKEIIHKTDVGGVFVDIKSPEELSKCYEELISNARRAGIAMQGVLVQKMVKSIYETIVGGKRDPVFGPIVMFGSGGIYVEIFKDVSFRLAPIDQKEAMKMIQETKAFLILKGFRGKAANIKEVAKLLVVLSKIMIENPEIAEIDINPLLVGEEAVAVDAKILLV